MTANQHLLSSDSVVTYVHHVADATVARPSTAQVVLWLGSATPNNAIANDLWWDVTNVLIKRLSTGLVWGASGSTTYAAQSGAWTSWSPVITGGVNPPTYTNNGSAYRVDGKTLYFRMSITYVTLGTGAYSVALPVGSAQLTYGSARLFGGSVSTSIAYVASSTHIQFVDNSNSQFGSASISGTSGLGTTPTLAFSGVIETT